jgi:hypothetical protein
MIIDLAEDKANILFNALENFPLEGNEASFKMSFHSFLKVRFLIGIRTSHITLQQLESICIQLKMPDDLWNKLKKVFSDANVVLFGFDEGETHCTYKIYAEFLEKNSSIIQQTENNKHSLIQYTGYKWDAFDPKKSVITHYYCYPFISTQTILKKIEKSYQQSDSQTLLNIVQSIVNLSLKRIFMKNPFMFLEVCDENSQRKSFDLNLYNAGITIGSIHQYLIALQEYFEISDQPFYSFLFRIKRKPFGHLSGGIDRNGIEFLSVYYDI